MMEGILVRRTQPHLWLFVVASLPFAISALIGLEYGGAAPYLIFAMLCIIHPFRPSLLGWGLIVAGYVVYLAFLVIEAIASPKELFRDFDDGVFATALLASNIVLLIMLARSKPGEPLRAEDADRHETLSEG